MPLNSLISKEKRTAARALQRKRQKDATDLRLAGLSYREIADKLGFSHMTVKKLVDKSLAEYAAEIKTDTLELRAEELKRLDELLPRVWIKARSGDIKAIDCAMRVLERRSKLLGIEPATKIAGHDGKALIKERTPYDFTDAELVAIISAAVTAQREAGVDGIPAPPSITH